MIRRLKSFFRLAAVVVVPASLAAAAAVTPNPYRGIPERNVFHLRPPASQISTQQPPPKPLPPKVSITGLVELRGAPKALIEISEPGKAVTRSILASGGAFGSLEILHIDVAGGRVRVRIAGDEETLSIEKPKPGAAPPSPPVPVVPPATKPAGLLRG